MKTDNTSKEVKVKFPEYPKDILRTSDFEKLREENKRLIDSNRELLELVKWITKVTNSPEIGKKCDTAINNAKAIL